MTRRRRNGRWGDGWVRHGSERRETVAASRQRSVGVLSGFRRRSRRLDHTRARIDLSSARQASPNALSGSAAAECGELAQLLHRQVAREILLGDAPQQAFRLGENRLRGGEPDAIGQRVDGQQFLGIFELVGERVDEEPRAFADEFAVELLALAHVPRVELAPGERFLGDPGGRDGGRSADQRAQHGGHGGDEIRVHGYPAVRPLTRARRISQALDHVVLDRRGLRLTDPRRDRSANREVHA